MDVNPRANPRREPRYEVRIPVRVSGIDIDGHYFNSPAKAVNGSMEGMGILLEHELYPFTALVISMRHDRRVLQIQTEVRHVTPFARNKKLVGVRIHKVAVV